MVSARARRRAEREATAVDPLWPLPDGWDWLELGDVCEPSQYGWTTKAGAEGDLRFLRTTDISSGRLNWETVPFCRDIPADVERYLIREGDILISRAGSVGKSFLIEKAERAVFASYLIRYRPKIEPRYVHYWLRTNAYWAQIVENTAGIAVPNVNASKLDRVVIPLPDPDTQRRIVARIDELFAELDDGELALARARSELETYRKALLRAAVTGELTADWRAANPPKETGTDLLHCILTARRARWESDTRNKSKHYTPPPLPTARRPASLPDSWEWVSLGQLSIIESGGTPKGIESIAKASGEIPWFKVSSMSEPGNERFMTASKWWLTREQAVKANLRIMPSGSVVFPKLGGALMTNKRRRLAQDSAFDLNNMGVAPLPPVEEYLWRFFEGLDLAALSDGSIVPQLKAGTVSRLGIGLPPEEELAEVIRVVSSLADDTEDSFRIWSEGAAAASSLRQSILAAAFRGELVQ